MIQKKDKKACSRYTLTKSVSQRQTLQDQLCDVCKLGHQLATTSQRSISISLLFLSSPRTADTLKMNLKKKVHAARGQRLCRNINIYLMTESLASTQGSCFHVTQAIL